MPAGRWRHPPISGKLRPILLRSNSPHDKFQIRPRARAQITPAGLMFLAITSMGWGINWPINKYLLSQLPPFTMRGVPGVIGAGLLALLALAFRQSLHVPREIWPRLVVAAFFNVGRLDDADGPGAGLVAGQRGRADRLYPADLGLAAGLAGSRRAAEPVAGDFAGHGVRRLSAIMGGNGFAASMEKLPGMLMALGGAIGFAIGTVLTKKFPLHAAAVLGGGLADRARHAFRSPSSASASSTPTCAALSSLGWS